MGWMGIEDSRFNRKMKMRKPQYSMLPYYKGSRRTLSPLASPVPTMKSAEFSVVCLRENHGFSQTADGGGCLPFWESTAVCAVELRSGYRLQATAEAFAEAAFPVPPSESPRYFAAVG